MRYPKACETSDRLKLQEDLLIEIFLRSSLKSLLNAECVCKQWFAFIKNTNFVLKHLQFQKSHYKGRLFFQHFKKDTRQYTYALFDDGTLVSKSFHDLDHFRLPNYTHTIHIEGPIDGLYCLFNCLDRIILWNPSLMEVRIIPMPQTYFFPHTGRYEGVIGFGIDPSNHDYKLILIRRSFGSVPPYVTVYNLIINTWKLLNVRDFHLLNQHLCQPIGSSFLSGIYYWCTMSGEMIAFGMGDETFRQILGPDLALPKSTYCYKLATYNDKVAFLQEYELSVDIWVMLEEGIWFKQFSIASFTSCFWVVGLWKNDEVLLVEAPNINYNYQMVLCNANTRVMRNVGPKGYPFRFEASIYYESLVSISLGTQDKGKCTSLNRIADYFCFREYDHPSL